MNVAKMSPDEIPRGRDEGAPADLGPAGLIRFMQQFETGSGDYSVERHGWLPESGSAALAQSIRAARQPGEE